MMMVVVATVVSSSVMMVMLTNLRNATTAPLGLRIEGGGMICCSSPINVKVKGFKLAYIGHHTRGWALESIGLGWGSQARGSGLAYLVEVVRYIIEHEFLSTHYSLIIRGLLRCLLLLSHPLVEMLVDSCLGAIMSMMNVRWYPTSSLWCGRVRAIVMVMNVMDVRRYLTLWLLLMRNRLLHSWLGLSK